MGKKVDEERSDRDYLIAELMDLGKTKEQIMAELNITGQAYEASMRRMNRVYVHKVTAETVDEMIEAKLRVTEKVPKVKKFTDRTGKTWDDVSEFWGL